MNATISASIGATYGLPAPLDIHPLTSGTNNPSYRVESASRVFFLKRYLTSGDATSLRYEHRLLAWLASRPLSFAISTPLPTRDGETLLRLGGELYGLFTWLPGEVPAPTYTQAEAYGAALGELHIALASFPTDPRPGMDSYGALDRVHPHIPRPAELDVHDMSLPPTPEVEAALAWWRGEVCVLQAFIDGPYRRLPWQVIHGDVAFVNSLFVGETLTALLDFEFATPDARAIDLAAALRSLLRRHDPAAASDLARALMRGYRRHIALTDAEAKALPLLMQLGSGVSSIWWLGRDLAAGDTHASLERIVRARQLAQSLKHHRLLLLAWLGVTAG